MKNVFRKQSDLLAGLVLISSAILLTLVVVLMPASMAQAQVIHCTVN